MAQDKVFIELKKKYNDVVYKRRESLSQLETLEWIVQETPFPKATQIGNEIDYFLTTMEPSSQRYFCPMSARHFMRWTAAISA